jgi:hypothetical protein
LTNLDDLNLVLSFYKSRWGIESMFKDCKTGGYNLEKTGVNETRFLALVLLVAIATPVKVTNVLLFNEVPPS